MKRPGIFLACILSLTAMACGINEVGREGPTPEPTTLSPLALAGAKLGGEMLDAVIDFEMLDQLHRSVKTISIVDSTCRGKNVFNDIKVWNEMELLKNKPNLFRT